MGDTNFTWKQFKIKSRLCNLHKSWSLQMTKKIVKQIPFQKSYLIILEFQFHKKINSKSGLLNTFAVSMSKASKFVLKSVNFPSQYFQLCI